MPIPLSVLNIEVSRSDSDLIARLLKKADYKLTFKRVDTEAQMRAALKKHPWDLIISDLSLPQFDSYAALALLHAEGLDIPFVTVSGQVGEEAAVAIMKAGAHDFLLKNNPGRLISVVERELEYAKIRREHRHSEETLKASERRFRALIENSLDDISLLAADGTLIWESPSIIRHLDYAPNEFVGRNIFEIMHPQDLELNQKLFGELVQKPANRQSGTFRLKHRDGTWRWVEATASNLLDDASVQAIVINYRDVTERKQAEEALQQSEQRLEMASWATKDVLWEVTLPARENISNESLRTIFRYPVQGIAPKVSWWRDHIHPDDRIKVLNSIQAAFDQGWSFWSKEYRFRLYDDIYADIFDRGYILYTKQDGSVKMVGAMMDITDRKQAEAALLASQSSLEGILQSTADGILAVDTENKILFTNHRFVEMWRITQEALFSKDDGVLIQSVLDQLTDPHEFLNKVQELNKSQKEDFDILHFKDGRVFERYSKPILGGDDHLGRVWSFRDVTERKGMETALLQSEKAYRTLFENVPVSLYRTSAAGQLMDANPAMFKMFGYQDRESLLEVNAENLYALPALNEEFIKEVAKSDSMTKMEVEFRKKDGETFWAEDYIRIVRDENGIPKFYEGSLIDITERKRAEQDLVESESRFRQAIAAAGAIPYSLDYYPRHYTFIDKGIKKLAGVSWEEMTPEVLDAMIVESHMLGNFEGIPLDAATRQVREGAAGPLWKCEHRIRLHSGEERWIVDSSIQVLDENNIPKGSIGIFQDITTSKLAETKLRESEKSLRESQMIAGLGSYVLDIPSMQWTSSDILDAIFGVDKSYAHTLEDWRATVHPDWQLEMSDYFTNRVLEKQGRFDKEYKIIRKNDGAERWVHDLGKLEFSFDNQPVKMYGTIQDITERKQAEENLKNAREFLKSVQDALSSHICILDHKGDIVQVNSAWRDFGDRNELKNPDHCVGMNYLEVCDSANGLCVEESALVATAIRKVIAGEKVEAIEYPCHTLNEQRWFVVRITGFENNGQKWIVVAHENITNRKQAEEALRGSEQRYRILFEDLPVPIWDQDFSEVKKYLNSLKEQGITDLRAYFESNPDAMIECYARIKVLDVNRATLKMYHAETKEALLESLESGPSEGELEHLLDNLLAIDEGRTGNHWEGVDENFNGELIDIDLTWSVAPGHEVDFSRVIVTTVDISERKQAEEKLAQERNLLRLLIDNIPDYIYIKDTQGRKTISNISDWQAAGGKRIEDVIGKSDFDTYPPELAAKFWEDDKAVLNSGISILNLEEPGRDADGNPRWILTTKVPLHNAKKEIVGLVGIGRDITERKKAEAESKYQLAELEALYENGLAISSLLEPKLIAQRMVEVIDQKLAWHHAAIRLYDVATDQLELVALNIPEFNESQIAEQIVRINQAMSTPDMGLSGWVIRHGEIVRVGKLKDDPRYFESYPGINSGLYVPIKSGNATIGAISIESEQENAFTERDARTVLTLANQAAISFVNARLYVRLQKELDERHRAEEEVRKLNIELEQRVEERTAQIDATKRRLELATQAGQIGVWEYIPRENKVIWDERMYVIHHIPPGEFDGTSEAWGKLIHPQDLGELHNNRQSAFSEKLMSNNEHRIIWPDGSVHNITASVVMIYGADGTAERLIGINMDITERKVIEQSLRESETYARLLFDAVPVPVSVTDASGLIVDVNKVFEQRFDTTRDESRGKRVSELGIYPDVEVEKREKYVNDVLEGKAVKPIELKFYVPGDRIHTLELHSYLLKVNGRELVLNTSHDITAHKTAAEIQRIAKAEMERALRIKNEFLANMSHELRTPLNSILGISESLEEQIAGVLNEKQLKYIGIVRESGRHLLDLINDILDLSKVEAGRMVLDIHHVAVEKLCDASLRMVKELAQKKSLNVSYQNSENIKIVLADERRLKQTLVNLLTNAVKFTPPGGRIGLQVSGNREANELEFIVWDHGIGIAKDDIQHLFKPFVQLDAGLSREFQGTGLGLALVAQMIHLHGGRVRVESEVGAGSRFVITLPWAVTEQTPKANVTAELKQPVQRSDGKRNGKILLVEDTDVVIQLLSEYLRYKGYEVVLAHNGLEGIRQAELEHPDLILMDVMMPIMSGLEATEKLRADETFKDTPIIALTALAMQGDNERCLAAGMNDYLSKPIVMQSLADMIEKYMGPT